MYTGIIQKVGWNLKKAFLLRSLSHFIFQPLLNGFCLTMAHMQSCYQIESHNKARKARSPRAWRLAGLGSEHQNQFRLPEARPGPRQSNFKQCVNSHAFASVRSFNTANSKQPTRQSASLLTDLSNAEHPFHFHGLPTFTRDTFWHSQTEFCGRHRWNKVRTL